MHPQLCATMSWFFISIAIIFSSASTSVSAQDDYHYRNCSESFQCGNLTGIGYPFFGGDRPSYCGYPGFELFNCSSQAPVIQMKRLSYQVLEIFSETRIVKVVRTDYIGNVCPTSLRNTTNNTLFDFSSDSDNITLYYGCSPTLNRGSDVQFSCNTGTLNYYVTPSMNIPALSDSCWNRVYVPAYESNIESLERNLTQENLVDTLDKGFGLVWNAENNLCETCKASGGLCGYNDTTASFLCLCQNGTDQFVCRSRTENFICDTCRSGEVCFYNGKTDLFVCLCTEPFVCGSSPAPSGAENRLCETCMRSGGRCGFSNITDSFVCESSTTQSGTGKKSQRKLVLGLSIAGALIVIGTGVCCFYLCASRNKALSTGRKNKHHKQMEAIIRNYDSLIPKRYSYSEIKKMTNSFKEKLGEGGFGSVYKGKLQNGDVVAVKILRESKGNGEDFINEVASFCRTSHVNVIRLLGFCYEQTRRALIYEYMSNGSLDKFISDRRSSGDENHLKWDKLYDIAIGIARGLEYLHRGCTTRIVHFDIKPHNILLDEDLSPKISDFGLAKLSKTRDSKVSSMLDARGTIGYIAPEVIYRHFGDVSYRADVYSYGMMVLEIIGARKHINVGDSETYFPDWIYDHIESVGVSRLHEIFAGENAEDFDDEERIKKMVIVGLWCIQMNPSDRPSMTKVVEMLEGSLQSLQVPPQPMSNSSATRLPSTYSSTTSQFTTTISSHKEENS